MRARRRYPPLEAPAVPTVCYCTKNERTPGRPKANLELTETQRQELERMARAGTSEKRMVFRARLILECATGADNVQVAQTLGTSLQTVTFWRGRFLREGMGGLAELARSGRPERIKPSLKGRILSEAVRPPGGLGRWSTRSMARHVGAIQGHRAARLVHQRH